MNEMSQVDWIANCEYYLSGSLNKPMSKATLICSAINCPFANTEVGMGKSSGCTRYLTSYHCHLKVDHPELEANEYWLFAKDLSAEYLDQLKVENDQFIDSDESSQRQIRMELLMMEQE